MSQFSGSRQAALDYNSTIIGAVELSEKKWVLAVQLPGVGRHSRHVLEACGDGLASFVERLKARCAAAGHRITRVVLTHEAGRDGFWQQAITRGDGRTRVDVVALATGQRLVRVVPRACRRSGGRIRKIMIVALARKLLVALWRYVKDGVIPDGAKMKAA